MYNVEVVADEVDGFQRGRACLGLAVYRNLVDEYYGFFDGEERSEFRGEAESTCGNRWDRNRLDPELQAFLKCLSYTAPVLIGFLIRSLGG